MGLIVMSEAQNTIMPLLYGGDCDVPRYIATCPECGETLHAECQEWVNETGLPTTDGIYVYCNTDPFSLRHKHYQHDWQSVNDAVAKWCGAEAI